MTRRSKLLIATSVVVLVLLGGVGTGYFLLRKEVPSLNSVSAVMADNGFNELKPPSNLVQPGAWVEVLGTSPLRLSIICNAFGAIGLADEAQLAASGSAAVSIQSKLSPKFSLDAATVESLSGSADVAAIRSVTLALSNIKLLEVADEIVMRGLRQRTPECVDAIRFRLNGERNTVSMIKSVLVADAEYLVDFDGSISAGAKAKTSRDLALNLGVKIDASDATKVKLIGQGLVWGIRDDRALARFGVTLPSTGGPETDKSQLKGLGPVVEADLSALARRTFSDKQTFASHQVLPLKQTTSMGCWATVYTMMVSWKERRTIALPDALRALGPKYVDAFVKDDGLTGGSERAFVQDAGMIAEPPANYMLRAFVDRLEKWGPLWITTGDGLRSHALLLVGIYGDVLEESRKAYDGAIFEFIDPASGTYTYQPAMEFMTRFEREAAAIVGSGASNIELRWQIIRWNSRETPERR